jgi:hypothetical protein
VDEGNHTMRRTTILAAAAVGLLAAAPAAALDLTTGVYEGKVKCTGLTSGAPTKFKGDVTVAISEVDDDSGNLTMGVNSLPNLSTSAMGGFVTEDSAKPDRGRISAVECPLNYTSRNGATVHIEVVVKPGGEKASVKGTLIRMSVGEGESLVCTFNAKRTSTESPVFEVCEI